MAIPKDRASASQAILDAYNASNGGNDYRKKMDLLQQSIDNTTQENEQNNLRAARGASVGSALDTAFAPRVSTGMIASGMDVPKNPMSASNVINAYQQTKQKGSEEKIKNLLSQYYAVNNSENTALGLDKEKNNMLTDFLTATKPIQDTSWRAESQEENRTLRTKQDIANKFDKLTGAEKEFDTQYNAVKSLIAKGTFGSLNRALSNMARLFGEKGALSENDVARQKFETLSTNIQQLFAKASSDPSAPVPAETVKDLLQDLETLSSSTKEGIMQKADSIKETYATDPTFAKAFEEGNVGYNAYERLNKKYGKKKETSTDYDLEYDPETGEMK